MTAPLVIIGCGGFGREVHDVVDAINAVEPTWELLGYVDDDPSDINAQLVAARGFQVLGDVAWLCAADPEIAYVIGIGKPQLKRQLDARLGERSAATLVHPSVQQGFDVRIGPGSVVCANTCLTTNIRVGRHVHVNLLCSIGHDVIVDDYVSINPIVAISGWVRLHEAAMIGTHASVLQHLSVGAQATVGGAACVVKDVPANSTVKGVPAR